MNSDPAADSSFERIMSAVMLVVFWMSFSALAAGVILWLTFPARDAGLLALAGGLLGLILMPLLRVVATLATAAARRDWLMLAATLTVLAILIALTLRDAATLRG
jgi:hypothetical protein